MEEIRSSNPSVVTGICDPNKSRARHHRSLKLGSKLKYRDPNIIVYRDISPLDTKYFNPNENREGFDCLCKNGLSVLHVNIGV